MVKQRGLESKFKIASAATSREEIGNPPHYGTVNKLRQVGIPVVPHTSVQMTKKDYEKYDYLIGMDSLNIRNMQKITGGDPKHKIHKLLEFAGSSRDISDPWYSGNFDATYNDIVEGCEAFLRGADPNLIVNLSEPAKDVKDKFLSILEIALLKKDSRTVSLLIMCGANVDDVDTSQVPPSTLSSLFQYKCSNPPFDNEDDQLQLQISDLSDSVSEVKEKTSYLLRERINSKEIVFKKNSLTNVVNEIRLQYVSFAKAVSLAKRIVETIKSKRMKLLDLLFKTLIAEDKEMFSKALDKDNEEWKIFCNMAIERLQKRLSESSEENQKKFANFCIDRILEEQQKLENEKNQIMNVFPEVENIEINDDKKRTLLLAQNLIYTKVKPMIETLIRLLNEFHEESVKAIELRINFFENSIETIDMFSKSHHSLERIGLSDIIIAQLESNNQPKEEIFEKSKEQLKEHLVLTKGLAKAMQDTLLYLLQ
ncbi:low molecular weight phosphotyrosine protein phosphatase [Histomonas meleagridis]|uniref:low molecular weight phosphotyrosine protein phosphatase n=1 Tax=Histomonas meleagridis TaxID=135588 RepID=UPI003559D0C7|nr:low molecular weight phosphotyrosine protein phosphatase [Histomonas meleagridis]KAH0802248.1 low molecular weight phosphotyrosine protein phosphatase [Histomonas meleagridis]